jgi:hypothetical protein
MSSPGDNMESTPASPPGKRGGGSFMLVLIIVLLVVLAGVYWLKNVYLKNDAGYVAPTNMAAPEGE